MPLGFLSLLILLFWGGGGEGVLLFWVGSEFLVSWLVFVGLLLLLLLLFVCLLFLVCVCGGGVREGVRAGVVVGMDQADCARLGLCS